MHEHMKGGNCLRTDFVGCLTPSPRIIKSLNPSLVQDLVFLHVLINIIRPIRHKWPITPSISQWLVATPNLVFSSYTHTHIHTYFFNMFTSHISKTNEILSSPMGVGFGSSRRFSSVDITHLMIFFNLIWFNLFILCGYGYYIHYLLSSSSWWSKIFEKVRQGFFFLLLFFLSLGLDPCEKHDNEWILHLLCGGTSVIITFKSSSSNYVKYVLPLQILQKQHLWNSTLRNMI